MPDNNRNPGGQRNNPDNKAGQTKKGSGQQTGGKRGEKMDKEDKEGYRSQDQKRQRGNHGGNR